MRYHFTSTAFAVKLLCISFHINHPLRCREDRTQNGYRTDLPFSTIKMSALFEIAADALMKPGNSAAAPALTKTMKRIQDHYVRWSVARALWYVAPNDQSAKAILNVARKYEGQDKYTLFFYCR